MGDPANDGEEPRTPFAAQCFSVAPREDRRVLNDVGRVLRRAAEETGKAKCVDPIPLKVVLKRAAFGNVIHGSAIARKPHY